MVFHSVYSSSFFILDEADYMMKISADIRSSNVCTFLHFINFIGRLSTESYIYKDAVCTYVSFACVLQIALVTLI
jgi:hypothetical protein